MFKKLCILASMAFAMPSLAVSPQDSVAKVQFSQFQTLVKAGVGPFANLKTSTLALGTSIPIWQITTATAQKYSTTKLITDLLVSPTSYFYPVAVNGTTTLLIQITHLNTGAWVSGGVGYASLVNEIALACTTWPAPANAMILVENAQTKGYLFHLTNLSTPNLTRFRLGDNAPEEVNDVINIKYQDLETPDAEVTRTLQLVGK